MSSPFSPEPRGVALLGSTGSIGRQTVDVLAAHPGQFRVVALATGRNAELLGEQAARLGDPVTALGASGEALEELVTRDDVDLVVGRLLRKLDAVTGLSAFSAWSDHPPLSH